MTLTEKKTYEFIKLFIAQHHYSPTTAEIAEGIRINSRGVVHRYLKTLQRKGFIKLTPHRRRNIVLVDHAASSIPLLGSIAAGVPIEVIAEAAVVDVMNIVAGTQRYALRVKGDSMIDEGICDGDLILCEPSVSAQNGQIVVALIDQKEATLKRLLHSENNTITLLPANPKHGPQVYAADRVAIQGIYVGLLRLP